MKLYITAVSIVLLLSGLVFARIPIEDIKGLDLTTEGYDDLNPLHGIPWSEGILENHGELLPLEHPLRELIQFLFHRIGTFDPSTSPEEKAVVPHLIPHAIGQFAGALKMGSEPTIDIPSGKAFNSARGVKNNVVKLAKELRNDPRVYRVLLALLWAKAQSKADFADYYEGVRKSAPAAVKATPADWLTDKFDQAPAAQPSLAKYDEFIFWAQGHRSDAPPLEHQKTSYSKAGAFPDCGETSLRIFLKLTLDRNGKYDVHILESLRALPEVIRFFQDFPDRESQISQSSRDAWADITIGRAEVKYLHSSNGVGYELDAGASNMFALIKTLLPEVKARDWEELARKIEEARKNNGLSSSNIEQVNLSNDFGEIQFRVDKLVPFRSDFDRLSAATQALV